VRQFQKTIYRSRPSEPVRCGPSLSAPTVALRRVPVVRLSANVDPAASNLRPPEEWQTSDVLTLSGTGAMLVSGTIATMPKSETRNEKLDLRLTPSMKQTIELAAIASHRLVSEFVLESARPMPRRR
jgi:hypothetical protein